MSERQLYATLPAEGDAAESLGSAPTGSTLGPFWPIVRWDWGRWYM